MSTSPSVLLIRGELVLRVEGEDIALSAADAVRLASQLIDATRRLDNHPATERVAHPAAKPGEALVAAAEGL